MSLKAFHFFFIAMSILLGMFVGGWGVRQYLMHDNVGSLAVGVLFFVTAFVLLAYGLRLISKFQELEI